MKRNTFLTVLLSIILFACSSSSESNNSNEEDITTLKVNNVYMENPSNSSWIDVIVTDGTYSKSSLDDNFYPDNNTSYIIHFLDLQLNGDFKTPKVFEQLYDSNTDTYSNNGTEGIIFYTNIKVENDEYKSSTDLTETEGYVKFEIISENNFKFYIEMIDGRKFQGNYNGSVNMLDEEYGFVPDIFWEE